MFHVPQGFIERFSGGFLISISLPATDTKQTPDLIFPYKTDLKVVTVFCPDWIPDPWFSTSWSTQAQILMKEISKAAVLSQILYKSFCNGNV